MSHAAYQGIFLILACTWISHAIATEEQTHHHLRQLQACQSSKDCFQEEYCHGGFCDKVGSCSSKVDCLNPDNIFPRIFCMGYDFCEQGRCGVECGSTCPPGEVAPRCADRPCEAAVCKEEYVQCVDHYCGGCQAIFFNAAGHQVCTGDEDLKPPPPKACKTNSACDTRTEYCLAGECREFGFCKSFQDCLNPANTYTNGARIDCVGHTTCNQERNKCQFECGDECPFGLAQQQCAQGDPCQLAKCDRPGLCVDYKCGSCEALFFGPSGQIACGEVSSTCTTSNQCAEGKYCDEDGACQAFGTCSSHTDCRNSENEYDSDDCEGTLDCNMDDNTCFRNCAECPEGQDFHNCLVSPCSVLECSVDDETTCVDDYCGGCRALFYDVNDTQVCKEDLCPDGEFLVDCFAQPCAVTECNEPYETCADNYCGGCHALFYDASGLQVCTGEEGSSCTSDADCKSYPEFYCSRGQCRARNTCASLLDCQNPSHKWDMKKCIGHRTCTEEGICDIICTGEDCPVERDAGICEKAPCEETTTCDEAVSCFDDFCECQAIFFNAQGEKQVCEVDDVCSARIIDCELRDGFFTFLWCEMRNAFIETDCAIIDFLHGI